MRTTFLYILAGAMFIAAALLLNCGTQNPGGSFSGASAAVDVRLVRSSLAEQITRVSLSVAADGTTVHQANAQVVDGVFQFAEFEVPVGNVSFSLHATNAAGNVLYAGDTTASVIAGAVTQLSIELLPAVPMIKLSPYFTELEPGDQFFSTLEMFNIERFYSGSFAVQYDPALISFNGTISQVGNAWGNLVTFARDVGDTVLVSITRTTTSDDTAPAGAYSLVRLGFAALAGGDTELKLICDQIEDLDGPIAERQVLHCDPQLVSIVGPESIPPGRINDLKTDSITSTWITLSWTAPGDDNSTGTAAQYDFRYSTSPITETNWHSALQVLNMAPPGPAGSTDQMTVPNLGPSTVYYFGIKAADEVPNWSQLSNIVSATTSTAPDTIPPGIVTDLRVVGVAATSVILVWTAPGDDSAAGGAAAQYDLRYSTSPISESNWAGAAAVTVGFAPGTPGANQQYTVTGLQSNIVYYFALKTADEVPNWSVISNNTSSATADGVPPAAITDLLTGAPTDTSITLQWTAPGDDGNYGTAAQYDIRYSSLPIDAANWTAAIQITGEPTPSPAGTVQSYMVRGLMPSTAYYFAMKTVDDAGNWSALSNVVSETTEQPQDLIPPGTIADLRVIDSTSSSITLAWTAPGDDNLLGQAGTYDLRIATFLITPQNWDQTTSLLGVPAPAAAGNQESVAVIGLWPQAHYYFAIKTADEVPNWSGLSNVASSTTLAPPDVTPPSAIADLVVEDVAADMVSLIWTAPGDDGMVGVASAYDIRYSTSLITSSNWASATQVAGEPLPGATGTTESFAVGGLDPATTYYFAIKTADEVPNWSGLSNVVDAVTNVGIVGWVRLDRMEPDIYNMNFDHSDYAGFDNFFEPPEYDPHWSVSGYNAWLEFEFSGQYDFFIHATPSMGTETPLCLVTFFINDAVVPNFPIDPGPSTPWVNYYIPAENFTNGTNRVKIQLVSSTPLWIDAAWIQQP
jgi:hypothetical protein